MKLLCCFLCFHITNTEKRLDKFCGQGRHSLYCYSNGSLVHSFTVHSRPFTSLILCEHYKYSVDLSYLLLMFISKCLCYYKVPTELDNGHSLLSSIISFTCMYMLAISHSINLVPFLATYCILKRHLCLHIKFFQRFVIDSRLKIELINETYEVICDLDP